MDTSGFAIPGQGLGTQAGALADAHNYLRWVYGAFEPFLGQRILEVGLGQGGFIPYLAARGQYLGVDNDSDVVAQAKQRHPQSSFLVRDASEEEFIVQVGTEAFDSVVCVNVLEHILDDAAAVRHLLGTLVPGGHLVLFVPALPFLYNDLDRLAGHHRRYTRRRVADLLPRQGVSLLRLEYFNPLGGLGWWAQKLIHHQSLEGRAVSKQASLFDRYILPFSRACNPLTRQWFGQSILCVVRKD